MADETTPPAEDAEDTESLEDIRAMAIRKGQHALVPLIDEAIASRQRYDDACDAFDRHEEAAEAHRMALHELTKEITAELIRVHVFRDAAVKRLPEGSEEQVRARALFTEAFPGDAVLTFCQAPFHELYLMALRAADTLRAWPGGAGTHDLELHRLATRADELKAAYDAHRAPIPPYTEEDITALSDESHTALLIVMVKSMEKLVGRPLMGEILGPEFDDSEG